MAQSPSIPKGTRDFFPSVMVRRNYIFDTIKSVFKLYGYQPIETPAMENLSTLMGKYVRKETSFYLKFSTRATSFQVFPMIFLTVRIQIRYRERFLKKGFAMI
jgi:histidyl-tRNA synthetase